MKTSKPIQIDTVPAGRDPFVAAAESSCMPMIFADASVPRNTITFANDSFLALTGFTRDELLGCPLADILPDLTRQNSASSSEAISFGSALGSGGDGCWELTCSRIDSTQFRASIFLSPVHDKTGDLVRHFLCFVALDGGYQRQLKQRDELRALYENAPGFIATAEGADHRITFANASYKKFVGREKLEGLTVAAALPEIVTQGFIDILDRVYRTGIPYRGTGMPIDMLDAQSGEPVRRYADFVYQPIKDDTGVIVGLFCEGYDVTGQHEATEHLALVQAELIYLSRVNAMGTMAVTLAHELNQPLSAISNYTSGGLRLVEAEGNPHDPIARALRAIDEASQSASEIIRTLRDLTKRRDVVHKPFVLKPAIDEAIRLVRAATLSNVEFIDRTPPGLTMLADRIQIQQIVINLLRNACDAVATSDTKTVVIDARRDDDMTIVCIDDTGPGLSLAAAEDIFAWSGSTKTGGMGLGLSICRTIVESHRGRIWLEKSSASGSQLCFSIPIEPLITTSRAEAGMLGVAA